RVALLEKRLGVTLLNRTPDGLAMTSAGQAILQQCTAMESAALDIDLTVGVRSLDIARRGSDLAIRFVRSAAPELVCRKLGEVGFSLYASQLYLAKLGIPKRGHGLGGYDLITFTGAPAAASPFFMGESLNGARVAIRCDI